MTRLTIDLPTSLHRTLKSLSVLEGMTMRKMAISALEQYTVQKVTIDKSVTEDEADAILHPVLMQYAQEIEQEKFKGRDWEDFKQELSIEDK